MGFFDFSLSSQPQNQIDKGREALKYFHNQACKYSSYNLTFDQLLSQVGGKRPDIFLEGMGTAIEATGMGSGKVEDAMEALADRGQGKVPASMNSFFSALSDRATTITFTDAVGAAPQIATEVAGDVVKGAASVGDTVLTTLSSLQTILPLLVVGGVIYVFVSKVRKVA